MTSRARSRRISNIQIDFREQVGSDSLSGIRKESEKGDQKRVLLTSSAIQTSLGLIYFTRATQYFDSSSQRRFAMGKINWARVLVGGLLAGFIINIFEYVTNGVVLAADWDAAMKALGRHLSMSAVAVFIVGASSEESQRSGYMPLPAQGSVPVLRPQR
jgi:hypothetical protein